MCTCLLYGQVRELELADKHGGGFDEREPRRSEEAGVGRVEHDVKADAERQDERCVPAEEERERAEDLGNLKIRLDSLYQSLIQHLIDNQNKI